MSLIAIFPVNSFRPFPIKSSATAGSRIRRRLRNGHSKGNLPLCLSYTHSTQRMPGAEVPGRPQVSKVSAAPHADQRERDNDRIRYRAVNSYIATGLGATP